jgi:ATPase family AAA domain-containing protein 1
MTKWDGLTSSNQHGEPQRICILGATNRIQDIDEAILRRMPKKFPISLPSAAQRANIFRLILRGTKIDAANFDLDYLTKISAGMSGSDIKDVCRDAAMVPVREYIKRIKNEGGLKGLGRAGVDPRQVRGVRTSDFFGTSGSVHQMKDIKRELEELDDGIDYEDDKNGVSRGNSTPRTIGSSEEEDEHFRDSAYHDERVKIER